MQNLLEELKITLGNDERLIIDGQLVKNKVVELALAMDAGLIALLLRNESIKEHFFKAISGVLVFDKVAFQSFVSNKQFLPDSYTTFKNKIGLTANGEYLTEGKEVVLAWPYKDCVLEGGQTKEDQKRKEIFWNETLAPNEIDRLLAPKAFTNFKKCDKAGEHNVGSVSFDDNLIIKGNNLLSLVSLKPSLQGKVDLIYIDPPFNKGGDADTFQYNNTFKTSTWLTFMKNRLDEAKKLLHAKGVLIVAIDETEMLNLGLLIKEIFPNHENHCITIVHNPGGKQGTNFSYSNEFAFFVLPQGVKSIGHQKLEKEEIEWEHFRNWGGESLRSDAKNCFYAVVLDSNRKIIGFGDVTDDDVHPSQTESVEGKYYVYPVDGKGIERKWRYARQSVDKIKHLLRAEGDGDNIQIKLGKDFGQYKTVWTGKKYDASTYGTKLVKKLVPNCRFSFPKSLWNVYDCIRAVVADKKDSIVLDYHAGSGTTAHAVLALNKEDGGNRKFILCEQMDYVKDVTVERVKAVLKTENINANFTYCELIKHNANIIDKIEQASTAETLKLIWQEIEKTDFISYKIKPESVNENIHEFEALTIEEQRQFLIAVLDKNQLYVNYADIDDEDYQVSDEDKKLNKQFYGEG